MTKYKNGYNEYSPTIKFFWETLESFDQTKRKAILKFWSALTRLPPLTIKDGQAVKTFSIYRIENGLQGNAHTCSNQLALPDLTDKVKIEEILNFYVKYTNEYAAFEIA
jgi:hypothetical protein